MARELTWGDWFRKAKQFARSKETRMRGFVIAALAVGTCIGLFASASAAPPGDVWLRFEKIYTDGKDVLLVRHVPVPGKTKEVTYIVKVPVQTKSGVQYVDEVRTAIRPVTEEERFPATRDHAFTSIDGKPISKEKLLSQIPEAGKPVIAMTGKDPLPAEWKALLREDAVIMRFNPPPFDDEQE
jgi:hypothetical protein